MIFTEEKSLDKNKEIKDQMFELFIKEMEGDLIREVFATKEKT